MTRGRNTCVRQSVARKGGRCENENRVGLGVMRTACSASAAVSRSRCGEYAEGQSRVSSIHAAACDGDTERENKRDRERERERTYLQ
jgi:hypothetical protein